MKVDVVIPAFRPTERFLKLIDGLESQSVAVNRIIVMNTEKKELEKRIDIPVFLNRHPKLLLFHLSKAEFDHGATRNAGVLKSEAELFVCMTQDALAANEYLIENLVKALMQGKDVAVSYARQLPDESCNVIERYTRQFNYPDRPQVKGKEDIPKLGIKTFFCSNVCAAYRREIFDGLGGFAAHTIFNEDMIYAAQAVKAGYRIAYAADAQVIHSHNYTAWQQFTRNFDMGVSHAQYPEVFENIAPQKEGRKLVKKTAVYLLQHDPLRLPKLAVQSAAKLAGYKMGKNYEKLPVKIVKRCSMQKGYWEGKNPV